MSEDAEAGLKARSQQKLPKGGSSAPRVPIAEPSEAEQEHQILSERLRQTGAKNKKFVELAAVRDAYQQVTGKRPHVVDLEPGPLPKKPRAPDFSRAVLRSEEDAEPNADSVTIACPPKSVQFVNHMIIGSQMDLEEVDELPKKALREEAGRAFRLQASASMDMWLCMNRAINAAERAKRNWELGQSKVTEASKILQDNANLAKDKEALARQLAATEEKLAQVRAGLDDAVRAASEAEAAKQAIHVALEESERAKAAEVKTAVDEAIRTYRSSEDFSVLLDTEVGSEMVELVYRFKRYNPGMKLNLNFSAKAPPLPEGVTEEMIEAYAGEDAEADPNPEAEADA